MNTTTTTTTPPPAGRPPAPTPTPGEVAAALYGAVATRDLAAAAHHLTPDAVLHVPGSHPLAGDHHGRDAVIAFVTDSSERTDRTEQIELIDLQSGATHATAYCRVTGRRAGRTELENTTVHVLRVEDGAVAEIWFHNWDQPAVDRFWS